MSLMAANLRFLSFPQNVVSGRREIGMLTDLGKQFPFAPFYAIMPLNELVWRRGAFREYYLGQRSHKNLIDIEAAKTVTLS